MATEVPLQYETSGAFAGDLTLAKRPAANSLQITATSFAAFSAAPVVQPASANQAALSLDVDVTGADTVDKAAINTNFTALQTLVNQLRTDLIALGLIKGSA